MSCSFARIFTRFNSFARLGRCTNSSNPSRGLSLLCASNKLQKNGINGLSNIGLVSVNKGYYVGRDVTLFHGYSFDGLMSFVRVKAPEDWPSVPIVPIKSTSLLPVYLTQFKVTDKNLIEVLKRKMAENEPYIGMFLVKDEKNESKLIKNSEDIYPIGTFAKIYKFDDHGDHIIIAVVGDRRISINNLRNFEKDDEGPNNGKTLFADIKNVKYEEFHYIDEMKELVAEIMKTLEDIINLGGRHGTLVEKDLRYADAFLENPVNLTDFSASLTADSAEPKELQQVLEETNIHKRLELCLSLLKKDLKWRLKSPENRARSFVRQLLLQH